MGKPSPIQVVTSLGTVLLSVVSEREWPLTVFGSKGFRQSSLRVEAEACNQSGEAETYGQRDYHCSRLP